MTNSIHQPTPREIIDPKGRVPQVTLVPNPGKHEIKGSLVPEKQLIQTNGTTIGEATLTHDRSRGEAWFNGIKITDETLIGKGYGLGAYLAAIEDAHSHGETFRTHDWSQTDAAVKVWNKFIDAGIAEVVEPFVAYTKLSGDETVQINSGHVRIPPTSKG